MAGLFALSPSPASTEDAAARFVLPPLEEDAPGVERLLGTIGRSSLGMPAFPVSPASLPLSGKLEDCVVPLHEEVLPSLPDLGSLELGPSGTGIFPSLDVSVHAAPPEEDEPDLPPTWGSVDDWRSAADPVAGPSRPKVRQLWSILRRS